MKGYYYFRRKIQNFITMNIKRHPVFTFVFLFLGAPILGLGLMSTVVIGITAVMAKCFGWN